MNVRRTAIRDPIALAALVPLLLLAGLAGTARAAIVGLERVSPSTPSNSSNKSVTATCPAGKKLVGGGGDTTPGNGQVLLDDIRPSADLQTLTVSAVEDENGATGSWFVQAFAICAYPPAGLERVSATSPLNSSNKSVSASCPAGKRLLGTGAELNAGNGQVLFDDIRPSGDLTSLTVNALEDENGQAGPWNVVAHAICANPVQGLERRSLGSALDSSDPKVISSPCTAGKQLTGVAGDINAGNGQVVFDAIFPDAGLTSAGLAAGEDETGFTGPWSLNAYAICADSAQRVVATGGGAGSGTATATCPAGKQLTGTGGDVRAGNGQVLLEDITPESLTSLRATAFDDETGFPGGWAVNAIAVCATPLPGLELISDQSGLDSFSKSFTINCPPGKQVTGAGGLVPGFGEIVIDDLTPNAALTSVTLTGFEDETGFSAEWSMIVSAICAAPPPGLERVTATTSSGSDEIAGATATCPSGKHVLGAGGEITSGVGQVVMDDIRPDAALRSVTVIGIEDETGTSANWGVNAYAICANH